ncbi:hypothetical protein CAPN008_00090 [Capnocytophaga canis]|nr:hypothetical protein CAPN008_00090 [Capnocytophaga canis]
MIPKANANKTVNMNGAIRAELCLIASTSDRFSNIIIGIVSVTNNEINMEIETFATSKPRKFKSMEIIVFMAVITKTEPKIRAV